MNDLDLEDLESRLYSQVYHGSYDETDVTFSHQNSGASYSKPVDDMRKKPGRYFGSWSPAPKYHKNAPPKNNLKASRGNRHEGCYNKSFGRSRKPEISINQLVVLSPQQPIVSKTHKEKSRARSARWKLKLKEKIKQKKAQRVLTTIKPVEQKQQVITLSDSEDDSCVIVDKKWPVVSVADSDDEKQGVTEEREEKCESNDNKPDLFKKEENILNESLPDDVIFVEPVAAEVINLDEDTDANKDKHSETASSTSSDNISVNSSPGKTTIHKIHQERKELLRTPDSASNDFMNNSGVELNQNNFNFSLHGSDFNNGEFLKPAPRNETCETESSSSTTDINSGNLMKTIVFNEVDFPKEDIFSENNLESFGNFITPLRSNASLPNVQSSPLKHPENKNGNSSDSSSESDNEEPQIEKQKDVTPKLRNLPELSPMQFKHNVATLSAKKTKKRSSLGSKYDLITSEVGASPKDTKNKTKKKKSKKKRASSEENSTTFETAEPEIVEDTQVGDDLKKKKKRKSGQMENSENGENQPKRRNTSNSNSNAGEETNSGDRLAPVEVIDSRSTPGEQTIEDKSENDQEVAPSVVIQKEIVADENTHNLERGDKSAQDQKHEQVEGVENIENEVEAENEIEAESYLPRQSLNPALDGFVVVDEVFSQSRTVVFSYDDDSILSPLNEQTDIQLNCEETGVQQVFSTVEFGMDLNNFSVAELQLKMSNDPKLWTIAESDRSPSKKNRGRRCTKCKQFGHVGIRCTNRVEAKCTLCGGRGHYEPRCPNKICTQCGQRSPYSTTYCNSCFQLRNYRCQLCSMTGHLPDTCPDLWRRYHLTTTEGPLTVYNGPPLKEKNQLWCSGCARSGHLEHSCRFYKSVYPATDPFVKRYEEIYKEEARRQEPLLPTPPQNYDSNNQLYQPISPRQVFGDNYVQNAPNHYTQVNPQFVNPYMDGVFVANQQNYFPMAPNVLQLPQTTYPPTHNQFVFDSVLPTFISFETPPTNSYPEPSQLNSGSRNLKPKRNKAANYMFFSASAFKLKQFIIEELQRLAKVSLTSNKLLHEVKRMRAPTDYELLNMLLFGVFTLGDGKMHLQRLKQFTWWKHAKVCKNRRNKLYLAYCYIFGSDVHPNVDYNELLRIV